MALTKQKLIYIASDVDAGDAVAAFLRTSSGALTSSSISGKEALDVNVLNDILVDIDGLYHATNNPSPDSVGVIAHTRGASPDKTTQTFRPTGGQPNAGAINPANIHGLDVNAFLVGWDGSTGWDRLEQTDGKLKTLPDGNVADDAVDAGNPLKVGSRTTGAVLSTVSNAGDRADIISDMYRRLIVSQAASVNLSTGNTVVTDDASTLIATALAGRIEIIVQNLGNKPVYLGDNTVTDTTGLKIEAGGSLRLPLGQYVSLYGRSASGNQNIRWMQVA